MATEPIQFKLKSNSTPIFIVNILLKNLQASKWHFKSFTVLYKLR